MTEKVLFEKKASILLIEFRERKDIIIGAPHPTIGGVKNMPCPQHPDGDENTGIIARRLAEKLKSSSIIACNYQIDPNKNLQTDYAKQIINWKPKFLIEIHGHGAKKIDDNCIEISSGSIERNEFSKSFATTLKEKFIDHKILYSYKIYGDFSQIHFQASQTATIIDNRWISFHIELPPSLRLNNKTQLPKFIDDLVEKLTITVNEICV